MNIADEPHLPGMFASRPFDAEGVPTRRKRVVSGGVLATLLHNLKTANKQGVSTTANGARRGHDAPIAVAPSNLLLEPSDAPFEAMLAALGDGLLITQLQGWHAGADPVSGDFSLPAKGYRVRGGEICEAVDQITLAGNFFSALREAEAVGSDLRFTFPSTCAFASPCVLLPDLSVAGK